MSSIIDKIDKIKMIEIKIKDLKKEKIGYMTNDEMRYIRDKLIKEKTITTNDLMRYSKSFSIEEEIIKLEFEKDNLKTEIKNDISKIKEFYKKYLLEEE